MLTHIIDTDVYCIKQHLSGCRRVWMGWWGFTDSWQMAPTSTDKWSNCNWQLTKIYTKLYRQLTKGQKVVWQLTNRRIFNWQRTLRPLPRSRASYRYMDSCGDQHYFGDKRSHFKFSFISKNLNFFTAKPRSRPILRCGYPENTTAELHSNVRLQCIVAMSGVLPDFRWLHWQTLPSNYEKIDFKSKQFTLISPVHYATLNMKKEHEYGSELILNSVTEKDFGLYTCIASNHLGMEYRSAFLTQKKKPKTSPTQGILTVHDKQTNERTNERTNEITNGRINEQTNERANEQMK